MRLLYVCLDPGVPVGGTKGASTHLAEMVRAFRAEGHDVTVLARQVEAGGDAVSLRPRTAAWTTRILRGPLRALRPWVESRGIGRRLREQLEAHRPDLVYERYALGCREGLDAVRAAGVRHVLEVNAPLAEEAARFRRKAAGARGRDVELTMWRGTDLVVVPSSPLATRVRAAGQRQVLVVPNAVDPSRFTAHGDRRQTREDLGLADRFVVAFVGSLKPWHDLDVLVDGVAALPARHRAALLVVGEGPQRGQVEARAAAAGLHCTTVGAVAHERVVAFLAAADACVASLPADPALDYFSPLKALEYLAAGRATVVARVGDLRELADADVALGYAAGDPASLMHSLERLADEPDLRAALGRRGQTYAATRTWQAGARAVIAAAQETAAARPALAANHS
jgi:glycosyltransferase involved in cell wall biosynthesis